METIKTSMNVLSGTFWLAKKSKKETVICDGPFFSPAQAEKYQSKAPGMEKTEIVQLVRS